MSKDIDKMTPEERRAHEAWCYRRLKGQAEQGNKARGKPVDGYDCPKCHNMHWTYAVDTKSLTLVGVWCDCNKVRESYRNITKSGLKKLDECTLENFETVKPYQQEMKAKAQEFIKEPCGKWLFLGGRSGSGKTHICTAVCHEFLKQGKAVRYMKWREEAVSLKALITDSREYNEKIRQLKNVEVLYIDDLLKTAKGTRPTPADITLAFEIIDARYSDTDLITLISSELSIFDIIELDEATGGRIRELSKNMTVSLASAENYRLK